MQALNNITTTDAYTNTNTVEQGDTVKVNLYVANASVYVQMAESYTLPHSGAWRQEVFYGPGHYNFARKTNGVRVRSATPGVPAQVTIEMLTVND